MVTQKKYEIDALENDTPLRYVELNRRIHQGLSEGYKHFVLRNVLGQRFIAAGLQGNIKMDIYGIPGNDLGVFMDGPEITVFGNAEDQTGNTMSSGTVIVHGNAWDVTGLACRGGEILVKGNGGYRIGIHMKAYSNMIPKIAYCGRVRQFFGEYMAGGILLALGMDMTKDSPEEYPDDSIVHSSLASGIHGGTIYVRGNVNPSLLGVGAKIVDFTESDKQLILPILKKLESNFGLPLKQVWERPITKIIPGSHRPFGDFYTYVQI